MNNTNSNGEKWGDMGESGVNKRVLDNYKFNQSQKEKAREHGDKVAENFWDNVNWGIVLYHACLCGLETNEAKKELDKAIKEI